jgi:transposase
VSNASSGCPSCAGAQREIERLKSEIQSLRLTLEEARRAGKRQAAPFRRDKRKKNPRPPGRKSGKGYGTKAHRPPPNHVDETVEAPLADPLCPDCGEPLEIEIVSQFQEELPKVRSHVTEFRVHVGVCTCGTRVQGRHPRQTSDALGAAASQIGPRASALAAHLNKELGIPLGKVQRVFRDVFDLTLSRAGVWVANTRVARVAEPTYHSMIEWIRAAPVVSPDETGWYVRGRSAWAWAFVTPLLTYYAIRLGRGYDVAAEILGADFAGTLARDGFGVYRSFLRAIHQTCLAHLLRRSHEMLEVAQRGAARVPWAVSRILKRGLELRDRRDAGKITMLGLAVEQGKLEARLDRLLTWKPTDDENRKLLKHLGIERDAIFRFLLDSNVPATNHWAEQEIRPLVVARKISAGNRSWRGAHVLEVIASVFRTARRQGQNPLEIAIDLLRSPEPMVATVLAPPYVAAAQRAGRLSAPS